MFMEERHQEILEILSANGRISIGDIQERFGVSVDSARRDLRILEGKKLLKRTHGGAIPLPQAGRHFPMKWSPEGMEVLPNYAAIAHTAAGLIQEHDAVYLTSGTLGYLMIPFLPDFPFTVVTGSIDNAQRLREKENITIYLVGGKMRPNGRMVDNFAQEFVRNMRFDLCFLTGAGFTAEFGISNGTAETAVFQRIVVENSRRRIALFPGVKVGQESFMKVVDAALFDTLVTDEEAPEDELAKLEECGVQVLLADSEEESSL